MRLGLVPSRMERTEGRSATLRAILDKSGHFDQFLIMQVKIHEAKANLSSLIAAVESGGEVVLARHNKPVARLVPAKRSRQSRIGTLAGRPYRMGKGFDNPVENAAIADDFGIPKQ